MGFWDFTLFEIGILEIRCEIGIPVLTRTGIFKCEFTAVSLQAYTNEKSFTLTRLC